MIITREFKYQELKEIEKFVLKKLNLRDLFKLRDRFEGQAYLVKTTHKILILRTLINSFKNENDPKLKIGFLSTLEFTIDGQPGILYSESVDKLKNPIAENDLTLYGYVNLEKRFCSISLSLDAFMNFQNFLLDYTEKFNSNIYE